MTWRSRSGVWASISEEQFDFHSNVPGIYQTVHRADETDRIHRALELAAADRIDFCFFFLN